MTQFPDVPSPYTECNLSLPDDSGTFLSLPSPPPVRPNDLAFHSGHFCPCLHCPTKRTEHTPHRDGALGFGGNALSLGACMAHSFHCTSAQTPSCQRGLSWLPFSKLPVPFGCFILLFSTNTPLRYAAIQDSPDKQWAGPWKVGQATCTLSPG